MNVRHFLGHLCVPCLTSVLGGPHVAGDSGASHTAVVLESSADCVSAAQGHDFLIRETHSVECCTNVRIGGRRPAGEWRLGHRQPARFYWTLLSRRRCRCRDSSWGIYSSIYHLFFKISGPTTKFDHESTCHLNKICPTDAGILCFRSFENCNSILKSSVRRVL